MNVLRIVRLATAGLVIPGSMLAGTMFLAPTASGASAPTPPASITAVTTALNVMVPAYFGPPSSYWTTLNTEAAVIPNRLVAIANPNSGPGTAFQQSYGDAITALQAQTGRVVGYVATGYAAKSLATVETEIDSWYSWYPTINGIFFDEVANATGQEAYYQSLYNYVKTKNAAGLVVDNPGSTTQESYLYYNAARVADVICTFESASGFSTWSQASWTATYDRSNFYELPFNTSLSTYKAAVDHAYQQNAGWIYVTNDKLPNPWDTLPSYFVDEVNYIKSLYN